MPLDYLAATTPGSLTQTLSWILAGLVVVVGLFVLGFKDLLRFSVGRVWAISGVGFDESIRRRVLWIIPLAILGIIAVVQFQKAVDPQDTIRQSTKICLFATGVVVIVTTIILACTSLPKEIDSRVIFTIVTKPTTRLEIVLGKIVGFARVSGLILLIMGLFSLGFLKLQESRLLAANNAQLADPGLDRAARPLMEYYKSAGLLGTKSMELADAMQVMGRPPGGGFNEPVHLLGGQSQYFAVAFDLSADQRAQIENALTNGGFVYFATRYGAEHRQPTEQEIREISELNLPTDDAPPTPTPGTGGLPLPSLTPRVKGRAVPQVMLQVVTAQGARVVDPKDIGSIAFLRAQQEQQQQQANTPAASRKPVNASPNVSADPDGTARAFLAPPQGVQALLGAGRFYVMVYAVTPAIEYAVGPRPTSLVVTDAALKTVATIEPAPRTAPDPGSAVAPVAQAVPGPDPAAPIFLSSQGRFGLQLLGREDGNGGVAAYHYSGAETPRAQDGQATLEIRVGLEGSAMDYAPDSESVVKMTLQVRNNRTGKLSDVIEFVPESNRTTPVRVPAEFVSGGEFDVFVRARTGNQWFGIQPGGLKLVTADRSFAVNLAKSLLTLWLMAILVISISVFASTFVSWPIAIVLTLVILLGRWGVNQIGDAAGSGLGAEVTQGLGLEDPTGARVVRTSVNFLQSTLSVVAAFLPDISKFSVTEDIERGISIPAVKILEALGVLLFYGVPMTVLAYVILRNKEVAP